MPRGIHYENGQSVAWIKKRFSRSGRKQPSSGRLLPPSKAPKDTQIAIDTEPPLSSLANLLMSYAKIKEQIEQIDEKLVEVYQPRAAQMIESLTGSRPRRVVLSGFELEIEEKIVRSLRDLRRKASDVSESSSASQHGRAIRSRDELEEDHEASLGRATALQNQLIEASKEGKSQHKSAGPDSNGRKRTTLPRQGGPRQEDIINIKESLLEKAHSQKERISTKHKSSNATRQTPLFNPPSKQSNTAISLAELLKLYNHVLDRLKAIENELWNIYNDQVDVLLKMNRSKETVDTRVRVACTAQERVERVLELNKELQEEVEDLAEDPLFEDVVENQEGNVDSLIYEIDRITRAIAKLYQKMAEAFDSPSAALPAGQHHRHKSKKTNTDVSSEKLEAKREELLKLSDRITSQRPTKTESRGAGDPRFMSEQGKAEKSRSLRNHRHSTSFTSGSGTAIASSRSDEEAARQENADRAPRLHDLLDQFDGKLTLNAADAWQSEAGSTRPARLERFRRNKASAEARLWDRRNDED